MNLQAVSYRESLQELVSISFSLKEILKIASNFQFSYTSALKNPFCSNTLKKGDLQCQ